jgi:tetratricopeptide (TPR) repeat protein
MAEFSKKGYIKQILIFLESQQADNAYNLAREFAGKMPEEMLAHFLLAKAAFAVEKYDEAAGAARKAFNLASNSEDLATCAVLAATSYYMMKEYAKGYEFLDKIEKIKNNEEIQQLLFFFSVARTDDEAAARHMESLFALNDKTARDLLQKVRVSLKA